MANNKNVRCSFCGKSQEMVKRMSDLQTSNLNKMV